jgi:predicted Zn-dependent protease
LTLLLIAPLFATTGAIVRLFHAKQARIARDWRVAGGVNLRAGEVADAIADYRNSLLYEPGDGQVELDLARALARQGQVEEARNYLSSLHARDPENSAVNLELARIAAKTGDVDSVTFYYHEAIYGRWNASARENRLAARNDLIEFLLGHGRSEAARAEALAMSAEEPADADVRASAGEFLLRAGDPRGALEEFRRTLAIRPRHSVALAGAAHAAMALGRFGEAARDLALAEQLHVAGAARAGIPDVARELAVASRAAELDPYAAGITDAERRRRAIRIFELAGARAKECFPDVLNPKAAIAPEWKELQSGRGALPAKLNLSVLAQHPEWEEPALSWAFAVEEAAQGACGGGSEGGAAVRAIAAAHPEKKS